MRKPQILTIAIIAMIKDSESMIPMPNFWYNLILTFQRSMIGKVATTEMLALSLILILRSDSTEYQRKQSVATSQAVATAVARRFLAAEDGPAQ